MIGDDTIFVAAVNHNSPNFFGGAVYLFQSTVTSQPDLKITKTAAGGSVIAGAGTTTYTIVVTNIGAATATSVSIFDPLPTGFTLSASTTTQGNCSGTDSVTCNLGQINASSTATTTVTVSVGANVSGSITNTATTSASETEISTTNNSASATITVIQQADLSVTKTVATTSPLVAGAANKQSDLCDCCVQRRPIRCCQRGHDRHASCRHHAYLS